jgi:hypothetical protein
MTVSLDPARFARAAAADRLAAGGRYDEAALAYRDLCFGEGAAQVRQEPREVLLTRLLKLLCKAGRDAEAHATFAQILPLLPACDDEFDAVYCRSQIGANVVPVPFARRLRVFGLTRLLRLTAGVAGDVAECGTGFGLSSTVLCAYLALEDPAFRGGGYHACDSFEGLSEPQDEDRVPAEHPRAASMHAMTRGGMFGFPLERLRTVLAAYPEIDYHPGWIPQSLASLPERHYRFVHVDVDLYAPTLGAFEYFFERLSPGGIIASDDYSWPGARKALERFAASSGARLETNVHDQAWISRPC